MEKKPDVKMYDAILPEFAKYMRKELEANYLKGDRNGPGGWLEVTDNKFWIQELYYHVGKLQAAVMAKDVERIKENTADIANISMMMLDVNINLLPTKEVEYDNRPCSCVVISECRGFGTKGCEIK